MRRIISFLCITLALFLVAPPALHAQTDESLCALGGKYEAWVPFPDEAMRAHVDEFTRLAGLEFARVLFCASESKRARVAWSMLTKENVFVVGIHRRFAREMPKHVRTALAHEAAHLLSRVLPSCVRNAEMFDPDTYVRCEYETDRIAARWMGRGAVLEALRDMIVYITPAQMSGTLLLHMAQRIYLLELYP